MLSSSPGDKRGARKAPLLVALASSALLAPGAFAEPYLAVKTGLQCSACHVNRTGGGGRTAYGAGYGGQSLPVDSAPWGDPLFDGVVTDRVRLGSDLRGAYIGTFQDQGPYVGEFRVQEANVYLSVDLLPDRLTLYADERFAPGGAVNREAFVLLRGGRAGLYVKAGKFFLPYGLRLQDDEAMTRRFTGFNFNNQDVGVEIGAEAKGFSTSLAASNGTGGGSEVNNGKQISWIGSYARPGVRAGLSASHNNLPGTEERRVLGGFAGATAGSFGVLAEVDTIRDLDDAGIETRSAAGHVELNWMPTKGLLVRAWRGRYDPNRDVDLDRQDQAGTGIDWTPWPGIQIRGFYRTRGDDAETAGSADDQAVVELHLYF